MFFVIANKKGALMWRASFYSGCGCG